MPNILLIPIDNRPVCYQLPSMIVDIFSAVNLFIPPKSLLGGLKSYANYDELLNWCNDIAQNNDIDYVVLSLDTIAYGGLVASRRVESSLDEIQNRVLGFLDCFKNSSAKIFATSSIMRISNNNVNEEEKEYWSEWGEKIFEYSYRLHSAGKKPDMYIPKGILDDYLTTRKRNFDMNLFYLDLLEKGLFDLIVFSQDDTAKYGLNVQEGEHLKEIIDSKKFNACVKTGADEVPLTLLSRAVVDFYGEKISINPIFLNPEAKKIVSRYEDVTIQESLNGQVELCGAKLKNDGDIDLIVNAPNKIQDDVVLEIYNDEIKDYDFELPEKPFAIADIKLANGADDNFVKCLLAKGMDIDMLGYAGWNTTANTLGTVLSTAIVSYVAKKYKSYNEQAFDKLLVLRFLDDWAYQANVRQELKENAQLDLSKALAPYLNVIEEFMQFSFGGCETNLPWGRTFEVEICLDDNG